MDCLHFLWFTLPKNQTMQPTQLIAGRWSGNIKIKDSSRPNENLPVFSLHQRTNLISIFRCVCKRLKTTERQEQRFQIDDFQH